MPLNTAWNSANRLIDMAAAVHEINKHICLNSVLTYPYGLYWDSISVVISSKE